MRRFINVIKESYLSYPERLDNSREIASYIESVASDYVDTEFIEEYFFDCYASLKLVPIDELHEGNTDANIRNKSKERKYTKMNPDTIPPLVVENGEIKDGNHRYRVAVANGAKSLWCYVVEEY